MTEPTLLDGDQERNTNGIEPAQDWSWRGLWAQLQAAWRRFQDVSWDPRLMFAALAVILLIAAGLRLTGLNWDENQHLHPDERFLTMVENSLKWPKSFKEYLNTATNPLNPYNHDFGTYVYGLYPLVLAKFVGELLGKTGYDGVFLVGRALSAVMDMLSIVMVFLTGRRLYNARAGLVGALLLALAVLNIQQSHYFTVDTYTAFFTALALYFAVRIAQGEGWGSVLGLGFAFGMAVSAKISVASFLLVIVLAYALRAFAAWQRQGPASEGLVQWRRRLGRLRMTFSVEAEQGAPPVSAGERLGVQALRAVLAILALVILAAFIFRIVQPQAFTGPGLFDLRLNPKWKQDMNYIQKLMTGEIDYPPSHQWAGREPWYALKNMVLWGLGVPLGLTVLASWALMAYEMLRKRDLRHLLPWAWMTFTFVYQSIQFVKPMRYLLPIYPTMALMAGYGLIWLWDYGKSASKASGILWWRRAARPLSISIVGAVLLGTALWALAFTSIYTRPVSRVTASRWMYRNLPKGSSLSFEQWDDPLPLNIDGRIGGAEFRHVQMDLYWDDNAEKRAKLYEWLQQTDYIVLSSNRLYGSIPRLPTRFPMTTRYYEALFSGELGYDLIAVFTSRPQLFGIEIIDDDADESFTVYDHPKVHIFQKRADFSMENVRAIFDVFDLDRIVRVKPRQLSTAPNNLMLSDEQWAVQRAGGTWADIFSRNSLFNRLPTLTWYLALQLLALATFPLGFVAFRRLRDRGYILHKALGVLLLGYLSWLLPSLKLLSYTRATIVGVFLVMAAIAAAIARVQWPHIQAFVRARWRLLLTNELLFLGFFLVFWTIRHGNPDLWHPIMGGEKPMDLAYLNAIIKSTSFPPYDPWFAGGYINYYYFGLALVATLIKFTAIVPTVAYNLAVPTWFAMTAMGAACVTYNLLPDNGDEADWWPRALRWGLLGAFLVAVAGNLGQVQLLWNGLQELGKNVKFVSTIPGLTPLVKALSGLGALLFKGQRMPFRPEWWYWNASRIMKHGEINEFPFFTFLYADLHAHLTALPFTLLALGLAVNFLGKPLARAARVIASTDPEAQPTLAQIWRARLESCWHAPDWALILQLTLLGLALGGLWCSNSWDFPTYLGVAVLALAIGIYAERRTIDLNTLTQFAIRAGYVLIMALLLYRPYHANFGLAYSSAEPWKGERTALDAYLLIWGLPLFALGGYVIAQAFRRDTRSGVVRALRLMLSSGARRKRAMHLYGLLVRYQTLSYELGWLGLLILCALVLLFLLAKAWVLLLAVPLLVIAALLTLRRAASPQTRFVTALIAVGAALTAAVEYIVLKGDIGRMNTVFKFYLQVWVMWGVAAAVGIAYLVQRKDSWPRPWRSAWQALLMALLVGGALYPITASYGKINDRWDPRLPGGLDGMQYMTTARYNDNNREMILENDRKAILWLQDHVQGSPVIAEANAPLYRWGNRISKYTGLPAIVGWDWHQKQQRTAVSHEVVEWRLQDLRDLYNTHDPAVALKILQRYQVGYVIVGELERAYYDAQGLAKFDRMVGETLTIVYQQGPVTIYRVNGSGAREVAGDAADTHGSGVIAWLQKIWIPAAVHAQGPDKPPADLPQPTVTPLMLDVPVEQLPALTDRGWNTPARTNTLAAVLSWLLVVELLGLVAWPLTARLFPTLEDRGYPLAKGLGVLLVSYLAWMASSLRLAPNTPYTAWGALLLVGLGSFFFQRLLRRQGPGAPPSRRLILLEEGIFLGAFCLFVIIRLLNPDLWQPWFGGEKMMEIAILNALDKSAFMPPYDPYCSGGYLNYYYYGHFIVNVLTKLSGLLPEVAFNLAVPTFFALTASHSFWLGRQLIDFAKRERDLDECARERRRLWGGAAAALAVTVMANLSGVFQVLEGFARAGGAAFADYTVTWDDLARLGPGVLAVWRGEAALPPFDYWYRATRIIPYTINEFPFFSFLFADLHPHMIAIPFGLLMIALGLGMLLTPRASKRVVWLRWGLLALALGALGPMNTWDLPAYAALLGSLMLYKSCQEQGRRGILDAAVTFLPLLLVAILLYAPFYAHYRAQSLGLGVVSAAERAPLPHFMVIWGAHIAMMVSLLALWMAEWLPIARLARLARRYGWIRLLRRWWGLYPASAAQRALGIALMAAALALGVALSWQAMCVLAMLVVLIVVDGVLLVAPGQRPTTFVQRLLLFLGLGILIAVECFYLKDFLAGSEWRRMNTVFKFYIQVWVLLSLALGSAFPELWRKISAKLTWGARLWRALAVGLLAASFLYVPLAISARVNERFPGARPAIGTLDGTFFMHTARYQWPDANHTIELAYERQAIAWLWEHVRGTPVIAQAPLGFYREGGLMPTSYTGLPTLIGAHQREQRPWEQVEPRERDAVLLYTTPDPAEFAEIAQKFQVRYIYVGQLERYLYAGPGLDKFQAMLHTGALSQAYANERVIIYRVSERTAATG